MIGYVVGSDDAVANWVSDRLGGVKFGHGSAIGIERDGEIICGVVYHHFARCMETRAPLSIMATIASTDRRWATRETLRSLFRYPFRQLGVKRLTTMCRADADDIVAFNKRLGFKPESILRYGWSLNANAMLFRMLRHECRWLGD